MTDAQNILAALNNARNTGTDFSVYQDQWLKPIALNGSTANTQGLLYEPTPEPTTLIAGALLLLPFGASTLRVLLRKRAA